MKISNLRIENRDKLAFLVADIECGFSKEKNFWFSLPEDKSHYFSSDVYDSLLVAFFYPAMCYGEDIVIEGNVSKRLYKNLTNYVHSIVLGYRIEYHHINIKVSGFAQASQDKGQIIGTGYSGGVDSFATIVDHYAKETDLDYKINSLFFFHLGQYGDISKPETEKRARKRYAYCKEAADFMKLPYIYMDTNMFKFYEPRWEYYAGVFTRASAILSLQSVCRRYYVSGAVSFTQYAEMPASINHDFASYADPIIWPLLSTEVCDIIIDGCQYRRIDKIGRIMDYEPAQKYLNVCVNCDDGHTDTKNCGRCGKCLRTLFALDALGMLENFSIAFDVDTWKKEKRGYILRQRFMYGKDVFATENIDMYSNNGKRVPTFIEACIYAFCYDYPRIAINKIKRIISKQL